MTAPISPRPYQLETISEVREWWDSGELNALAVLPTGAGKTIIFAALGQELRKEGLDRVLILAHRKELVQQAADKWRKVDPGESVGIYMGAKKELHAAVISASVASCYPDVYKDQPCAKCSEPGEKKRGPGCADCEESGVESVFVRNGRMREGRLLGGKRSPDLDLREIDLIIIDEAHHVTPDSAYMAIVKAVREVNPACLLLLVTATPFREDRQGFGWLVSGVAFIITIKALIEMGYLVPFSKRSCRVELSVDMSDVRVSKQTGDFIDEDLGKALDTEDARAEIVKAWVEHAGPGTEGGGERGRPTVVFCPTVDSAEHLSDTFAEAGFPSGWICSDTKRCSKESREQVLAAFNSGEITVVVNVGVLTEGWDAPPLSCVVIDRPTKSRSLYAQMVGRGTRLSPETGKTDCLVMDCTGASALGLQCLADLSKPISKEDILGEEEEEEPEEEQIEFPEEIFSENINVRGHTTYRIDLFSGRVAWARINGSRVACLSPGRAVLVFGGGDKFTVCSTSSKGVEWLCKDLPEMEAMKRAEIFAIENGSNQWLNPGTFVKQRGLSAGQRGQIVKLLRWEAGERNRIGKKEGPGLEMREVGGLSMALASAWCGYLEARLTLLRAVPYTQGKVKGGEDARS